ncbi:MAG: adenylate/guanylate cyclase domain-containing response regulator [Verrucomicrobiota bacterium]
MRSRFRHDIFTAFGQMKGYADFILEDYQRLGATPPDTAPQLKFLSAKLLAHARNWERESDSIPSSETLAELCLPILDQIIEIVQGLKHMPHAPIEDLTRFQQALNKAGVILRNREDPVLTVDHPAPVTHPQIGRPQGTILIVDDDSGEQEMATRICEDAGHVGVAVGSLEEGIERALTQDYDAILLDWNMPGGGARTFLSRYHETNLAHRAPVILISAEGDRNVFLDAMRLGAVDFLQKPYDRKELLVRLDYAVRTKLTEERLSNAMARLRREEESRRHLVLNIFPSHIAGRVMKGENPIADLAPDVGVLFVDIVGFTRLTLTTSPKDIIAFLSITFEWMESLTSRYGIEKIKTIGDSFLAVSGLTEERPIHLSMLADFALHLLQYAKKIVTPAQIPLSLRMGLHRGPVIAGVVGKQKLGYDLWGDTVNFAARLERLAQPDTILTSSEVFQSLDKDYTLTPAGQQEVKDLGQRQLFYIQGKREKKPS